MARPVSSSSRGIGIDTTDLKWLAGAMRAAGRQSNRNFRKGLLAGGTVIAEEAKRIAAEHSQRIPPTIKVRATGANLEIRAGTNDDPLARLFEVGNRSGNSVQSTEAQFFRHPVFGTDTWATQPTHPFLRPAGVAKAEVAGEMLTRVFTSALREHGIHTE